MLVVFLTNYFYIFSRHASRRSAYHVGLFLYLFSIGKLKMGTKQYPEAMSISDQINNLKDDGLTIEDEEEAARILQRVSYYRLIKAYCTPFKDKASGKYRKKA